MPFEGVWALGETDNPDEAEMILTIRRASDRIYELVWVDADEEEFDGIGLEHPGGKVMSFYSYPTDEEDMDEDEDTEDEEATGPNGTGDELDLEDYEGVEISIGYFTLGNDEKELIETSALPSSDEITDVHYRWVSSIEDAEAAAQG